MILMSGLSLMAQKVGVNTISPKESLHVMGGFLAEGSVLIGESVSPPVYNIGDIPQSTDTSGVLYDSGGPIGDYSNSENHVFEIYPSTDPIAIRVIIDSMDTEAPYDYLVLDWGAGNRDTITGSTLGVFIGPPNVMILFHSNEVNTAPGFKLFWNYIYPVFDDSLEVSGLGGRFQWIPGKYALRSGFVDANQWDDANIGKYSFGSGFNSLASGNYSFAVGRNNIASGTYSIALGDGNTASVTGSTALGSNTTASGQFSTAMGYGTTASGLYSTALGIYTQSSGSHSTAIGYASNAAGNFSTAMGYETDANTYASTVLGKFNIGGGNATSWIETDPLFEIGIGTGSSARENAMLIRKDAAAVWGGAFNGDFPNTPPVEGAGTRMMWYPKKAAFRVGHLSSEGATNWNKDSVGIFSVGMGYNAKALGPHSVAIGQNTIARAPSCIALGSSATATELGGIAIGTVTTASGQWSTSIGYGSVASGGYSISAGYNTTAAGNFSFAIGRYTKADAYNSFASGRYNVGGGSPNTWVELDPLFEVGFGADNANRANAMLIRKDGAAVWGGAFVDESPNSPPAEGAGTRMMWYPNKAAFRAGYITGAHWDQDSIGSHSFASGVNTRAQGYGAVAMGSHTIASGVVSFAIGNSSKALGNFAVAMGGSTSATGDYSTTLGIFTEATGDHAIAMGKETIASGDNTLAAGLHTYAESLTSFATGRYNVGGGQPLAWIETDPLFEIGIGADNANRANAMTVLKNGKVGIGTAVPEEKLHVEGTIEVDQKIQANDAGGLEFASDEGSVRLTIEDDGDIVVDASTLKVDATNNRVGIGTTTPEEKLHVEGTIEVDQKVQANDADGLEFATDDGTVRIKIIDGGQVGIGTVTPGSHPLYVDASSTGVSGSTGYFRNTASGGIALSVENSSTTSTDNALLVTTQGSTGDIASFDSWHGTGSWDREFRFTNTGEGRCDGSWVAGGADYAEYFPKSDLGAILEPGDLVAMSEKVSNTVEKAGIDKRQLLIGVYSTNPAFVGNSSAEEDPGNAVLVGLMGVVPTKVCIANGPILIGDFLTASSTEGVAAKAVSTGMVIGRAMENYDATTPGLIKVMVEVDWVSIDNGMDSEALRAEIQELRVMIGELTRQQSQ